MRISDWSSDGCSSDLGDSWFRSHPARIGELVSRGGNGRRNGASAIPDSRFPIPGFPGGPSARSVEVLVDPGVVEVLDFGQRADRHHLPVCEYRHAVADSVQGVVVVGDEEHGQAQSLLTRVIGRAWCRVRVRKYEQSAVVPVYLQKKNHI